MSSHTRGPFGRCEACCAAAPVDTVAAAAPMTVRRLIKSPSLRSLSIEPPRISRRRVYLNSQTSLLLSQIRTSGDYLCRLARKGEMSRLLCSFQLNTRVLTPLACGEAASPDPLTVSGEREQTTRLNSVPGTASPEAH